MLMIRLATMITMPPEFAAGAEHSHDPGDEDPGEPAARHRIACERQAWKADTFHLRFGTPMGMGASRLRGAR